jgi:hypothetical protein
MYVRGESGFVAETAWSPVAPGVLPELFDLGLQVFDPPPSFPETFGRHVVLAVHLLSEQEASLQPLGPGLPVVEGVIHRRHWPIALAKRQPRNTRPGKKAQAR